MTVAELLSFYAIAVVVILLLAWAAYALYYISDQLASIQNMLSNLDESTRSIAREASEINLNLEAADGRDSSGAEK